MTVMEIGSVMRVPCPAAPTIAAVPGGDEGDQDEVRHRVASERRAQAPP
jgi:hypothetical protein